MTSDHDSARPVDPDLTVAADMGKGAEAFEEGKPPSPDDDTTCRDTKKPKGSSSLPSATPEGERAVAEGEAGPSAEKERAVATVAPPGTSAAPQAPEERGPAVPKDPQAVDITIAFKRETFAVSVPCAGTVADLKRAVERAKGLPAATQKLLYKGVLKDASTINELNIKPGAKVMLMASSVADLANVVMRAGPQAGEPPKPSEPEIPWSEMTEHTKVIDRGPPDDAEPGMKDKQLPLPPMKMLRGMLGKGGRKTRLTFKGEADQLWIGTSEYTQKVPLNSIRNVKSQPIKGREEYSIVALQLGPTDKSLYFLYYVPSQYVEALKDEILGAFLVF